MTGLHRLAIVALSLIVPVAAVGQEYRPVLANPVLPREHIPDLFDLVKPNNKQGRIDEQRTFRSNAPHAATSETSPLLSFGRIVTRHDALSVTWAPPDDRLSSVPNAIPVGFGFVYSDQRPTMSRSLSLSIEDRDARSFEGVGISLKGGVRVAF